MTDAPHWPPPRLQAVAEGILAEPQYVHTDSCGWMGDDCARPCSCRVPELLRFVAERVDLAKWWTAHAEP